MTLTDAKRVLANATTTRLGAKYRINVTFPNLGVDVDDSVIEQALLRVVSEALVGYGARVDVYRPYDS